MQAQKYTRLKRPGYRSVEELRQNYSGWCAQVRQGVCKAKASKHGNLLEQIGGTHVDMIGWLPGHL